MRINGVTYGKLKTPLKVNGNLTAFFLISLKNRHSEQKLSTREPEKYMIKILSPMSLKFTSRNKIKVAVAMATREIVIAPTILNREIRNFAQICTTVYTIILHPYFGLLLVQTKDNENHEFSHFFPEFIALSRKMNLTENNCKSPWYPLFWPK